MSNKISFIDEFYFHRAANETAVFNARHYHGAYEIYYLKAGRCSYFIDDATICGVRQVRILHGTGNGILRTLLRQYLNTLPAVGSCRDEHVQFGGAGITVVDLI